MAPRHETKTSSADVLELRGGYRGRGRGRGGRGGRGGKAPSGVSTPKRAGGRGRGRGRKAVETKDDANYQRRTALKAKYKSVVAFQKAALAELASRDIGKVKEDPDYHKTIPQYEEVIAKLREEHDKQVRNLDTRRRMDLEWIEREHDYNVRQANAEYQAFYEDRAEEAMLKIAEEALYVRHQELNNLPLGELPWLTSDPAVKRVAKNIEKPVKVVYPYAKPFSRDPPSVPSKFTDGDTEYYQHPANYFASLSATAKKQYSERFYADKVVVTKRKNLKRKRNALIQKPVPVQEPTEDTPEDGEESAAEQVQSGASTPMVGPLPDGQVDDGDWSDIPEARPMDKYGAEIPFRRSHLMKMIHKSSFKFDEDEIGFRRHYVRNGRPLGIENYPNPAAFYYEQVANNYNSAKHQPGDLDQSLVEKFKVHPTIGTPIPGCVNPDEFEDPEELRYAKRQRWREPVRSQPYLFVSTKPDGSKEVLRTSRSDWMVNTEKKMEEVKAQKGMLSVLESEGELSRPAAPQTISSDLLRAASAAAVEEERLANVFSPAFVPSPARSSSSTSAPARAPATIPGPSRRSHGYDPVRDRVYQTPYSQISQPRPAPAVLVGGLEVLADAAELVGAMAPPSIFYTGGAPSQMAARQQQRGHQDVMFYAHPPPPSSQYGSPRTVAGSSTLRELLPAPPRNRGPNPPRWY